HGGWRTPDRPPTGCRPVANGLTTPPHQPTRSPWPRPAVRTIASWPDSGPSGHAAAQQWLAFARAWPVRRWLRKPGSPGNGPAARRCTTHEKNITAAGNLRQGLLVPGAEPRGEIGDGGLRSEASVDQFQQPDAPGIGVAMLFRTQ